MGGFKILNVPINILFRYFIAQKYFKLQSNQSRNWIIPIRIIDEHEQYNFILILNTKITLDGNWFSPSLIRPNPLIQRLSIFLYSSTTYTVWKYLHTTWPFFLIDKVYIYFICIAFYYTRNYKMMTILVFNARKQIKLNKYNYYGLFQWDGW